ncbi:MAG TPA: VWA domain-containing protein [Polyangia bacterium]|nr:VWA domain-containing protein [Polyangia bacterium]
MRKSTLTKTAIFVTSLLVLAAFAAPRRGGRTGKPDPQRAGRHVDLVIALDTSGSMDGLIDSARQKLWDVVNLMAQARPQPVLRVGLISYGNDGYDPSVGWLRKDSDLTQDLDALYSKLFALRTNGGTEYVARAVHAAVGQMQWDRDPDALRIIFVAGNEPATQDPQIRVERAVAEAREHGILVNTIYCGDESAGEAAGWRAVASLGAGQFASINQNNLAVIATPMDAELGKLSAALNGTYVAYGEEGRMGKANQAAQDKNAASASAPAAAARAVAKAGHLYRNPGWDLVDAVGGGGKKLEEIKEAELPAELRALPPEKRQAYLDGKAKERADLQKQISELSVKREQYVRDARKRAAKPGDRSLDDALAGALRGQAEAAGFAF